MWKSPGAHCPEQGSSSAPSIDTSLTLSLHSDFIPQPSSLIPFELLPSNTSGQYHSNEYHEPKELHGPSFHNYEPVTVDCGDGTSYYPELADILQNVSDGSDGNGNIQHRHSGSSDWHTAAADSDWHPYLYETDDIQQPKVDVQQHLSIPTGPYARNSFDPRTDEPDDEVSQLESPWTSDLPVELLSKAYAELTSILKERRNGKGLKSTLSKSLCHALFLRNITSDLARMIIKGDQSEKSLAADKILLIPGPDYFDIVHRDTIIEKLAPKHEKLRTRNQVEKRKVLQNILYNHDFLGQMLASSEPDIVTFAISSFPGGRKPKKRKPHKGTSSTS